MNKETPIPNEVIENICKVIANTDAGLTGSEIGRLLNELHIEDPTRH